MRSSADHGKINAAVLDEIARIAAVSLGNDADVVKVARRMAKALERKARARLDAARRRVVQAKEKGRKIGYGVAALSFLALAGANHAEAKGAKHEAELQWSFIAGVCTGLRAAGDFKPNQPISIMVDHTQSKKTDWASCRPLVETDVIVNPAVKMIRVND
jgi:hypothetical protein